MVSSSCRLHYQPNCTAAFPGRCYDNGDCPGNLACCPAANCDSVGRCQQPDATSHLPSPLAGRAGALRARVMTLCLPETACQELGGCPDPSSCRPACKAPDVCVLFKDSTRPVCKSASHLCEIYGSCAGSCSDFADADEVRVECDGPSQSCVVLSGAPTCIHNTCPAGQQCYIGGSPTRRLCVDPHPCRPSPCTPGQLCREVQPHCVRAPCPPLPLCHDLDQVAVEDLCTDELCGPFAVCVLFRPNPTTIGPSCVRDPCRTVG